MSISSEYSRYLSHIHYFFCVQHEFIKYIPLRSLCHSYGGIIESHNLKSTDFLLFFDVARYSTNHKIYRIIGIGRFDFDARVAKICQIIVNKIFIIVN
jgi:hypothetical protein